MAPPNPCPVAPVLDHFPLSANSTCPFCHQLAHVNVDESSASTASTSSSNLVQQPLGAQYTPVTHNTVATLRQTVESARVARARAVTEPRTSNPSPTPIIYKFAVRVAHASYSNDTDRMPQATWTVWNGSWTVAIA